MTEKIIRNPNNSKHFMRLVPSDIPTKAFAQDIEVASSTKTLRLFEFGKSNYPEVIYFPKKDVRSGVLKPTGRTTHCPLKGEAQYLDIKTGSEEIFEAAWWYHKPYPFAKMLEDFVAFDKTKVLITEN